MATTKTKTKDPLFHPRWTKFIEEMIIHGDKVLAYENAFPGKRSKLVNQSAAGHLMRRPEIYGPLLKWQEQKKMNIEKELKMIYDESKVPLLTKVRKLEILAQIAGGTMRLQKVAFNKKTGEPVIVEKLPDHNDIMKAIEIDSKLVGDLAPVKSTIVDERLPSEFKDMSAEEIKNLLTKIEE